MSRPTEAAAALFVHRRRIAWWDTDAARIAYTARFPQFCMEAIEAWFIERLGTDWYALNESGRGTPFVHLSVDFRSPLTPHDALATTVALARAGGSSLEFRLAGRTGDGRLAFEARFVCVFVATRGDAGHEAIPIPDEFRAAVDCEAALAAVGS